jgi:hypothetical protein
MMPEQTHIAEQITGLKTNTRLTGNPNPQNSPPMPNLDYFAVHDSEDGSLCSGFMG